MIAVATSDGYLRIQAEVKIPSAESGVWDLARVGKLTTLIEDYIEACELVDATEKDYTRFRVGCAVERRS